MYDTLRPLAKKVSYGEILEFLSIKRHCPHLLLELEVIHLRIKGTSSIVGQAESTVPA